MPLDRYQRRVNARKLMNALSTTNLDFHTAQLAMIDAVLSALSYWSRELSEAEQKAMWDRVESAAEKVTAILSDELQTPAEAMLVLLQVLEPVVEFCMDHQESAVPIQGQ